MATGFLVYAFLLLATGVFLAALAAFSWGRRERPGATPLAGILVGQAIWSGCAAAAIFTRGTGAALFWSRAWYVGVTLTIAGLFVFALEYTGREQYLGRRTYALLAIEPILLLTTAATNPDGLMHEVVGPASSMIGWELNPGPGFWAHAGYSYLLIAVASVLLVKFALSSTTLRRRQTAALLFAIFVPWFGNTLYLFGDISLDPTPMAFSLAGVALTWAVFRGGLLDISPVAHQAVVESLNSAVFVVDTDDTIIEVNDAGAALLGTDDVVGEQVQSVLDEWPALREQYEPITGEVAERQIEIEQNDRHFDVQTSPLHDDRGELVGRVFLVHEITEQKARERELERRNRQLDQFASVVSHDLRNPLNVASGSLELARQTGDPEQFDRIKRSHERMSRLIEQVLALSRDEAHGETTTLPLAGLAERAWSHVATGEATLEVTTDAAIVANRDQALQLFENAFRNSVEHGSASSRPAADDGAEHGGDAVRVTVTEITGPDGETRGFAIGDDGPGIPADERDEVFDHGYTTAADGTGLGLAIVDHVATSHGWSVSAAESEAGGLRLEVTGVEIVSADEERRPVQ